jgi:MFS transporter, PAT family, beta-lactamase induction signal transducer AmpG
MRKSYKLILLFSLYLSQGLPFGFQANGLPLYMREYGISRTLIGFATAISLPWLLKFLWAPLVDRYCFARFGRRKSWIVPILILQIIVIVIASFVPLSGNLMTIIGLLLVLNMLTATQDIAVDGLAVDLLDKEDLGYGNSAQVVGFKFGIVFSGGFLVWQSEFFGWQGMFLAMACLTVVPLVIILFFNENKINQTNCQKQQKSVREIIAIMIESFKLPGMIWLIIFILFYKFGESMVDQMFKIFLLDSGFTKEMISKWVTTYGMGASIVGSLAGGLLATKMNFHKALGLATLLRIFPLILEWSLTYGTPTENAVIFTTLTEHFFGGILTTVMFVYMMSRVDRRIGATHFTVLASVEVLGKSFPSFFSGLIADQIGYSALFALGVGFSLLSLFFWFMIKPPSRKVE